MKILVIEPLKHPYVEDIDGSLKSMQEIIGGGVHATLPFDDSVNVVTTDMGKLI